MSLSTDRPFKKGPYLSYFHFVEEYNISICLIKSSDQLVACVYLN